MIALEAADFAAELASLEWTLLAAVTHVGRRLAELLERLAMRLDAAAVHHAWLLGFLGFGGAP